MNKKMEHYKIRDIEILIEKTEFNFCPICGSKKIKYAHLKEAYGGGGDFNHFCKRCESTMIMKCPTTIR